MQRLYGLDALRGIAAMFVAVHHLLSTLGLRSPIADEVAVDLFFMLSGYVMARTYEKKFADGLTSAKFISLRYRRLFAPLAIGSTLGLIWVSLATGPTVELVAAYALILAFLPAFWMHSAFLLNVPAWSLFLEITANTLHGSIFGRASTSTLVCAYSAITLVFAATHFAGLSHWGADIGSILWMMPRALSCYLMGILLWRIYSNKPLGRMPFLAATLFPAILVLAIFHPGIELAASVVAAPLILRASLSMPETPWAVWAGAISYPIYATHVPVLSLALLSGLSPLAAFGAAMLLAVAVTCTFELRRRQAIHRVPGTKGGVHDTPVEAR